MMGLGEFILRVADFSASPAPAMCARVSVGGEPLGRIIEANLGTRLCVQAIGIINRDPCYDGWAPYAQFKPEFGNTSLSVMVDHGFKILDDNQIARYIIADAIEFFPYSDAQHRRVLEQLPERFHHLVAPPGAAQ